MQSYTPSIYIKNTDIGNDEESGTSEFWTLELGTL